MSNDKIKRLVKQLYERSNCQIYFCLRKKKVKTQVSVDEFGNILKNDVIKIDFFMLISS